MPDNEILPAGVKLRDWEDADALRSDIYNAAKTTVAKQFPVSYGGVRLELHDVDYEGDETADLETQKDALMGNRYLARPLKGTYRLFDEKTGEQLDEQRMTVMKVPIMTGRGTFLHGGNEWCLQARTKILTDKGQLSIRDIVINRMPVNVLSYDFSKKEFVWKPVVNWFKRQSPSKLGRSKFDGAGYIPEFPKTRQSFTSLWATPDHRIFTSNGRKKKICQADKLLLLDYQLSSVQRQVLIGSLLGDGHLTDDGFLTIRHAQNQKAYLECKAAIFADLVSESGVTSYTYDRVAHPAWQTQYGFLLRATTECKTMRALAYPAGKRGISTGWYKDATPLALAVWFMDDGWAQCGNRKNNKNVCQVMLATNNFLKREVDELISWMRDVWRLHAFAVKMNRDSTAPDINWQIHMAGVSARSFLTLIAPFVHPSLAYKFSKRPKCNNCSVCGKEVSLHSKKCNRCGGENVNSEPIGKWWDDLHSVVGSKLPEVIANSKGSICLREQPAKFLENTGAQLERCQDVYDIEVADTHNFFANGVLVSNCTINQARLLPGAYVRRKDSGELETHVNSKRGTGSSFRIRLEPDTGLYKMDIGQSSLRLYSLLKDIGVTDEELEKRWGKDLLEVNRKAYDRRVFDKAYQRLVKRPDMTKSPEDRVKAIREALAGTKLNRAVMEKTHPNLFSEKVASVWRGESQPEEQPQGVHKDDLLAIAMYLNEEFKAGIPMDESIGALADDIRAVISAQMPGLNPETVEALQKEAAVVRTKEELDREAHRAATSPKNKLPLPTKPQKHVGNYTKGHVRLHGFDITIENPKGSIRSGTTSDGTRWKTKLCAHYGYVKKSEGADGDHLDVFIGPDLETDSLWVVNQIDPKTGLFDEHKVMIGFATKEDAVKGYMENYQEGWRGLGSIYRFDINEFRLKLGELNLKEPIKRL